MTAFHIVHPLVVALAEAHMGACASADTYVVYARFVEKRRELLAAHGWDEQEYEARVDDYVSDVEPG
ncbi:MAG: hypothetical protein EPN91_03550 [Salinibacterium sp.]|nr:MAG: hypothetical protein EPN91_03550 [Salinibacterium sp.]